VTIPATVTKSIGLPATALAPMVFAIPRQFHRDPKILPTLTAKQKPFPPRRYGNSLNHRAVMLKRQRLTRQLLSGQNAPKHNSEE